MNNFDAAKNKVSRRDYLFYESGPCLKLNCINDMVGIDATFLALPKATVVKMALLKQRQWHLQGW